MASALHRREMQNEIQTNSSLKPAGISLVHDKYFYALKKDSIVRWFSGLIHPI